MTVAGAAAGQPSASDGAIAEVLTGGQAVVRALVAHAVDTVFGIPAGHSLDIYDALASEARIRHILPRHEQGAGFMADGYARVGGRTGVALLVGGPGATNAMTALGEAYADSSPVLAVTSQIPSALIGQERGVIHELKNHLAALSSVTAWNRQAGRVEEIPGLIARAIAWHQTQRPRPIHVEIPVDVLSASGTVPSCRPFALTRAQPDVASLERAVARIRRGSRPVIYAGGGVNRAGAASELTALAERLGAPVLTTALGKGSLREDHPLYLATLSLWSPWALHGPIAEIVASADPLIVVGGRFSSASTCDWQMPVPRGVVHIDVDPAEINRNYPCEVAVIGDAKDVLGELLALLPAASRESCFTPSQLDRARAFVAEHARSRLGWGADLLADVRSVLGDQTILMGDSLIGLWAAAAWRTNQPRSYHFPMHFNTLGFALPAAIGAKLAAPGSSVVALAGDGAFMFTMAELSTAVQHRVPVLAIVCNDRGFSSIRRQQEARFAGRTYAADLETPDFARLAEAMGAAGFRVAGPNDFARCLDAAARCGGPAVVEVPLSVQAPWA
ncbi:MAG: thiamine pyrophosphate-binding protein [Chloroflexi bacterium]|nr:thiamine pyrophosphate-binding protein [Chloroflexota bacterium]